MFILRKRPLLPLLALALASLLWLAGEAQPALAFVVGPLPDGNLVANPWFHKPGDPMAMSDEGWIDEGDLWGLSRKTGNPSPLGEIGTAARFAEPASPKDMGPGPYGGADAYLYTILEADPEDEFLNFKTHWVSANIEIAEVTIYGGSSALGPWEPIWTPLYITPDLDAHFQWVETGVSSIELDAGFPYYKIDYHARYSADEQWGFKFTGVYFSTGAEPMVPIEPQPDPTSTLLPGPTPSPAQPPTAAPATEVASKQETAAAPASPPERRKPKPPSGGIVKDRN